MMQRQPAALFLFAFTQAWESFSYYGMRALLVLYLINALNYGEGDAFALYAVYTCLVEFGAFIGGYCADRFLGLRNTVILGGLSICIGHVLLTFADYQPLFFGGLAAIICGAMLFRSNLKALVGTLYPDGDPRREEGFTLFYVGINLGGFLATLACAYVAQHYGWHAGFGLAAVGMILGMGVFMLLFPRVGIQVSVSGANVRTLCIGAPLLGLACVAVAGSIAYFHTTQGILFPLGCLTLCMLMQKVSKFMTRQHLWGLIGMLGLLFAYFTFEELMGSLLMVFSENEVDRMWMGWEIPSSALSATNPLVIISAGPLICLLLQKKGLTTVTKMAIAFLCLAFAFALLYLAAVNHAASAWQMILSFAAIALGELFLAPTVYAACAELSPANHKGLMMGIVTLTFALASLASGQVSQVATSVSGLFLGIACVSVCLALGLLLFRTGVVRKISCEGDA